MTKKGFTQKSSPDKDCIPNVEGLAKRDADMHKRLSMEFPTVAPRDVLTINLGCIDEVKELQMLDAGREAKEATKAFEAALESHQPHGFVRVSASHAPGPIDITSPEKPHPLMWSPSRQLLEELITAECKEAALQGR
jgi:hypothetical protein